MSVAPGPEQALLALLVAGHVLGDFVFQTRPMVAGKGRPAVLLRHAGAVAAAHLLALLPFLSWPVVLAAAALGVAHGAVDGVKARWQGRGRKAGPDGGATAGEAAGRRLPRTTITVFLADQAVHAAAVVGAWLLLRGMDPDAWLLIDRNAAPTLYAAGVLVTGFAFVGNGGSGLVRGVLAHLPPGSGGTAGPGRTTDAEGPDEPEPPAGLDDSGLEGSGQLIGILERLLGLVLVLMGEWAALAVVLAAKSIARFEELRDRPFAEYYLVGTLASLLVAVLTGLAVQLALP